MQLAVKRDSLFCYSEAMRSVADHLRMEEREALLALAPRERVALALELGERDLEIFRRARSLPRREAARFLEQQRQAGRRHSRCLEALMA